MSNLSHIQQFSYNDMDVETLASIYCDAFIGKKYSSKDVEDAIQTITKHATYPGFKGVTYVNNSNEIVGFAYGYTSTPGQFYREKLENQLSVEEQVEWLTSCFEFVELAVYSSYRKKGIGRLLHDALLSCINHDTSILTTSVDNTPAINLYRKNNWQIIRDNTVVIEGTKPQVILGKKLVRKDD